MDLFPLVHILYQVFEVNKLIFIFSELSGGFRLSGIHDGETNGKKCEKLLARGEQSVTRLLYHRVTLG